jgi:hypothetical protein
MNLDFQPGYPPFNDSPGAANGQQPSRMGLFIHLLNAAHDRMEAFVGYAGSAKQRTGAAGRRIWNADFLP